MNEKCEECKQPITDEQNVRVMLKANPFVQYAPINEFVSTISYHKDCAPVSQDMFKILELQMHNPQIYRLLKEKDLNNWTWRETLEKMVLALVEHSDSLQNQLIQVVNQSAFVYKIPPEDLIRHNPK